MSAKIQRGYVLLQQDRYELAAKEFTQALADDPNSLEALTMLANCQSMLGNHRDAIEKAEMAVHLGPEYPGCFRVLGMAHAGAKDWVAAEHALLEALRLDPEDEETFGLLASVSFAKKDWESCLQYAERGLAIDPDDANCENFQALALERLGRTKVALDAAKRTLAKNPNDSGSQAIHAWALLNEGKYKEAQEGFKEALRLDPDDAFAREGMIQALNSNNLLFRIMFKYYSAMSRLTEGRQWVIIIGIVLGQNILSSIGRNNPAIEPFVRPLIYLLFFGVWLTWTTQPLFNVMLRFNSFGKHLLSAREKLISTLVAATLFFGFVCATAAVFLYGFGTAIPVLVVGLLMVIPVAGLSRAEEGWKTATMAAVAGILVIIGSIMIAMLMFDLDGFVLLPVFLLGVVASQIAANVMANRN